MFFWLSLNVFPFGNTREMNKKNLSIDFEYDYNFLLIGICSPLKEHQISYHLNKELNSYFARSKEDIGMNFRDGLEKAFFPLYEYWDDQYQNQWYLIANKCQINCSDQNQGTIFDGFILNRKKTKFLIPENPKVDFYLQVHGIVNTESKTELLKNIKNLNRIVSVHEINIANLRSKENLII